MGDAFRRLQPAMEFGPVASGGCARYPGFYRVAGGVFVRRLLQKMLSRSYSSESAGWCVASVLFGLSHITNGHFPNWRYVVLATIAGFYYSWTWRKTGSLFALAIVYALV